MDRSFFYAALQVAGTSPSVIYFDWPCHLHNLPAFPMCNPRPTPISALGRPPFSGPNAEMTSATGLACRADHCWRGRGLSHIEESTEEEAGIRHGRSGMPSACGLPLTKGIQGNGRANGMSMKTASATNASALSFNLTRRCQPSLTFMATNPKPKGPKPAPPLTRQVKSALEHRRPRNGVRVEVVVDLPGPNQHSNPTHNSPQSHNLHWRYTPDPSP